MSIFHSFFSTQGVMQLLILLALSVGLGAYIGRIKIRTFSVGMGGVLFAALFFGWAAGSVNMQVCDAVCDLGLVLFIYTLGIEVGPGFFGSLKKDGAVLSFLAAAVVLLGVGASLLLYKTGITTITGATGVLCGSVTNLPSLAAARDVLTLMPSGALHAGELVASAAAAYPPGMFIVALVVQMLLNTFGISLASEEKDYLSTASAGLEIINCEVGKAAVDCSSGELMSRNKFVISRLKRGDRIWVPRRDEILQEGDLVLVLCPADATEKAAKAIGSRSQTDLRNEECGIDAERMVVTSDKAIAKTIAELNMPANCGAIITRIVRAGKHITAHGPLALEFGDVITVVGPSDARALAATMVGNKKSLLERTDYAALFCGVSLGLLLGIVPIPIPGLPLPIKLGPAGGPIIVSLLLGKLGSTRGFVWRMPASANMTLREVGIMLFFAAVGLQSGAAFVNALAAGEGFKWMLCSFFVAFVPVALIGAFARIFLKINFLRICGMLAGATTNPPAMVYANSLTSTDACAAASALVYPLTTIMRITSAQLLIMLFYR